MTTLPDFTWTLVDRDFYDEKIDALPVADERSITVAEVPRCSMRMLLTLVGEAVDFDADGSPRFTVLAKTTIEGAMPAFYKGSLPVTLREFDQVDDPHRYGFMFVSCVTDGLDLVCTPWSYRHGWEGTLRRVCQMVGHGTVGYCLRASENGRVWSLEVAGGRFGPSALVDRVTRSRFMNNESTHSNKPTEAKIRLGRNARRI